MELSIVALTVMGSVGLGLAGAYGLMSLVFCWCSDPARCPK